MLGFGSSAGLGGACVWGAGLKLGQRALPIFGRGDRVKRRDQRPRVELVGLGLLLKPGAAEGARLLRGHGLLAISCRIGLGELGIDGRVCHDMGYYVQVAMTITGSEKTEDREYRPLEQIRDNYPKFVIARADPIQRRSGIIHQNATDLIGQGLDFGARSS